MGVRDELFDEGYREGKIIGKLDVIINMLKSNDSEADECIDMCIQSGITTEFMRQQALFYIRMGIGANDGKRKTRRSNNEK